VGLSKPFAVCKTVSFLHGKKVFFPGFFAQQKKLFEPTLGDPQSPVLPGYTMTANFALASVPFMGTMF